MARETSVPAQTVREEIRSMQEFPPGPGTPGIVQVVVGRLDADGNFTVPQQFDTYTIEGAEYDELVGEPPPWATDKPRGTFRNDDLWHFIDAHRAAGRDGRPTMHNPVAPGKAK